LLRETTKIQAVSTYGVLQILSRVCITFCLHIIFPYKNWDRPFPHYKVLSPKGEEEEQINNKGIISNFTPGHFPLQPMKSFRAYSSQSAFAANPD